MTKADALRADLFSGLRIHNSVDVLLFNPPYVPSADLEVASTPLDAAWAGGTCGRVVINRFLSTVEDVVSPMGCLYLLLEKKNWPDEVVSMMASKGFTSKMVLQRRAMNELLFIYRFQKRMVGSKSS